ncbi:hypothetical protein R5W24_004445 [Gemmata sp. JC717]|uniref:hypothetical protein n=1 Tax=Gemmata algarum TaxID=2975278 RepID=UPI0021BAA2E8|nr:hypothetical protein [Gemmata algarum]MDY3555304.1 hypothetical protein [Gemmata algarum]
MAFDFSMNSLKNSFFDTDAILSAAQKEYRKVASRFGAFARRRIKSSLKYRSGKSKPGEPPHVHRATRGYTKAKKAKDGTVSKQRVSPLRELVFFAYDRETESVVVGPVKFGSGSAPGRLEHGGAGTFKDSDSGEVKRGVYAARPFVKPAGDAEAAAGKFLKG